jgi:hypothetical protein
MKNFEKNQNSKSQKKSFSTTTKTSQKSYSATQYIYGFFITSKNYTKIKKIIKKYGSIE